MLSELYGVVRRARGLGRATPGRRAPRRCRPAVGGLEGLESRALPSGGTVARHPSAVALAVGSATASPTSAIQHALAASYAGASAAGQTIQTRDGAIFVPSGLTPGQDVPLVVAFAYNGNPAVPFQVWQTEARTNHWIVYASKDYTNAALLGGLASSEAVADRVKAQVDGLTGLLPVDPSRIIFTGMSGGANFAQFMNLRFPGYAAAVISNSGRIPDQLFSPTPKPATLTPPSATDFAGSRREAVFLCSPSDPQFFGVSQANERTMQGLGWDTLFLSFSGGHRNAPIATYDRAIAWITSQPSWTTDL